MKLSLSYPVTPYFLNQGFGKNPKIYAQFGIVGHNGLDLLAYHGQPVYASHDGIAYIEIDGNQGHGIVLLSTDKYEYEGEEVYFKTIYWHLCDGKKEPKFAIPVKNGQKVKRGELIGYADNTGFSTGDHLHYGLKPVGKGENSSTFYNIEQNNGYYGAIDPLPYLIDITEEEFDRQHPELDPKVTKKEYTERRSLFRRVFKRLFGYDYKGK